MLVLLALGAMNPAVMLTVTVVITMENSPPEKEWVVWT
jgi:hypothetical protein